MGMLHANGDDFLRSWRLRILNVKKRVRKTVNKVFEKAILKIFEKATEWLFK